MRLSLSLRCWPGWPVPPLVRLRPGLSLIILAISAVVLYLGVMGDQTLVRRAVNLVNPEARGRVNGLYTGIFFLAERVLDIFDRALLARAVSAARPDIVIIS